MAAAVTAGVDFRPFLESTDRAEMLAHRMVLERAVEHQTELEEARIHRMANEIASRFA